MNRIPNDVREKIWANFDEYRVVYLATSENNQPRVRPVTLVPFDSRFYILTGTDDAKVNQIRGNSMVELCLPLEGGENTGYARMSGKAIIIQEMEIKEKVAECIDYFSTYWKDAGDPNYTLLEIDIHGIEYLEPGEMLARKYII